MSMNRRMIMAGGILAGIAMSATGKADAHDTSKNSKEFFTASNNDREFSDYVFCQIQVYNPHNSCWYDTGELYSLEKVQKAFPKWCEANPDIKYRVLVRAPVAILEYEDGKQTNFIIPSAAREINNILRN